MNVLVVFQKRWILTTLLVIAGAALCARLGIWQLDRLKQRRAFNAHVFAMQAALPLQLPSTDAIETMEWRAVRATGTYDFEHQIAIRNQSYNDQNGYHLLTPLKLTNGQAVLVDRGWIPEEGDATSADWRKYDVQPQASIAGIIRLGQTAPGFGGVGDPPLAPGQTKLDFWIYVNIPRIGQQVPYPLLPVYVQLNPDPNRTDPPIPFQPELDLTEGPHEGYAIQWFSFSTLMLVGYPFYVRKQEKEKK